MSSIYHLAGSLLCAVLLSACDGSGFLSTGTDVPGRRVTPSEKAARAFDQLLDQQWQYQLVVCQQHR